MYTITLKKGFNLDDAMEILGENALFSSESPGGLDEIVVKDTTFTHLSFIEKVEPYGSEINWEEQWELYGPGFKEGLLTLEVENSSIRMRAGPGFGNLSHPTTCLMLEIMPDYVKNKIVFDIGTGSGVLALAAHSLNAKKVYACDIDDEAVAHAQENAELNQFKIIFDEVPVGADVTLLNMIWSEQKQALESYPDLKGVLISSGILEEGESEYLQFAEEKGWKCEARFVKEGWMAFVFTV